MKTRPIIPVAAAALWLTANAFGQTAATPAPAPRPAPAVAPVPAAVPQPGAVARRSSGLAPVLAAMPQSSTAEAIPAFIGEPQAPPAPPAPEAAPRAPRAPQAPGTPEAPQAPAPARVPRASTGEAPRPEAVIAAPRPRGQLVNLRLEFTVTDQIGAAPPVKKTITMNVADGESGRIRTNAEVFRKNTPVTTVPLSVDAVPEIEGGKIRLRASLDYQLLKDAPEPDVPAGKTSIAQSVTAILSDGVPTVLSQSADPLTDRKVTLEVKATILR